MLNYFYLSALVLAPILVTVFFRKWVHEHPGCSIDELEGAYTRATLWNIGGLILGAFAPQTQLTSSLTIANFALCLMSLLWIGYDYARALEVRKALLTSTPVETTPPAVHFKQAARGLAFIACLYALLYCFNLFGLILFFYATPLLIRVMFETLPMEPSTLRTRIKTVFAEAGVDLGHIRIIQSKKKNFSNAMVCGTNWGVGPFKRTLLITEHLFARLDEDEFIAVMRHEAAHFKLNHIPKRLGAVAVSYLLSLVLTLVPTMTLLTIALTLKWNVALFESGLTLIATIATFYLINRVTFQVIHRQEHEADVEAVKMGSSQESMISALQKITVDHGGTNTSRKGFLQRWILSQAHPSLEERILVIQTGKVVSQPFLNVRPIKVIAAYAAMIACTLLCFYGDSGSKPSREIASTPDHSAKISH